LAKYIPYRFGLDEFRSFHNFIVNCHARIEDMVVFPTLKEFYVEDFPEYAKLVDWIGNDHKLLEKLGNSVIEYGSRGSLENFNVRLELYFKILMEHNLREERQLFPNWFRDIDEDIRNGCTSRSMQVIDEFFWEKYIGVTGL
jgi:hemerythrin superfamily protein